MRKYKKIGAIDPTLETVLIWGALGLGAYFILKNILPAGSSLTDAAANLGVGTNPTVAAQVALPAAGNAFNPQFAPFQSFYQANGPDANGNLIPIQTFFQNLSTYGVVGGVSLWLDPDVIAASNVAQQLYSDLGGGFWSSFSLTTNVNNVMADLNQLTSQMQVAFVANWFLYNQNTDLLTMLQGSIFKKGLDSADLATVINHVNALPLTVGT